jgi:hypothetical protein
MSAAPTGFDVTRFRDWLAETLGEVADVSVTPIRGGGSLVTIDRGVSG